MANTNPEDQDKQRLNLPAAAEDYHSLLTRVIGEVTHDPAQLRRLVYALAWNTLKPGASRTRSPSDTEQQQAKATFELELAKRQLQRAIETIETDVSREPQASAGSAGEAATPQNSTSHPFAGGWHAAHPRDLDENQPLPGAPQPGHHDAAPTDNAVIILPERAPAWLVQRPQHELFPDYGPPWDRRYDGAPGYAPAQRGLRAAVLPFLQLVAAAFIGVVIYVGVAGWVQIGRQNSSALSSSEAAPPPRPAETTARAPDIAPEIKPPAPDPNSLLPFPLPRSYGVYAGSGGRAVELAQLPIKVPDPRVQVSAEITRPSRATLPTGDLSFVVFRRDLVNSAPQTVPVRVVARISRVMKFVDGKPAINSVEGTWRIRTKAYELKVSPLEGRPEMILLQPEPGFVFPPGRYALVLNGYGFDFAVEGAISAPEQCLEQAEMVNGTILNECPKS